MANELEKCKNAVSTGAEYVGSFAGGALGGIIAGPVGAGLGSIAGTTIGLVVGKIGKEISERILSNRESVRIGASMAFAYDRFEELKKHGISARSDLLNENRRAKAQELIEGVFQKAKEEYEEKKVEYLGYFYANILCNERIDFYESFHLLKIYESLSWNQILILAAFMQPDKNLYWKHREAKRHVEPHEWILLSEINELVDKNLLRQMTESGERDLYWGLGAVKPSMMEFTRLGLTFVEVFSIDKLSVEQMQNIVEYLKK